MAYCQRGRELLQDLQRSDFLPAFDEDGARVGIDHAILISLSVITIITIIIIITVITIIITITIIIIVLQEIEDLYNKIQRGVESPDQQHYYSVCLKR
jgi:hypothetical protein